MNNPLYFSSPIMKLYHFYVHMKLSYQRANKLTVVVWSKMTPPPHKLIHLNAWSPVRGTMWEGSDSVAFWKEVCHWGWALKCLRSRPGWPSLSSISLSSPCFLRIRMYLQATAPAHACLSLTMTSMDKLSATVKAPNSKLSWSWCLFTAVE